MIGKSIGRYKIVEKLGEGGMGTVWKAEDSTLGRMVALKFLSTDIPDDDERARFLREARAASALDHPGICTIYEADKDEDGNPYLAMAYCEGDSLRDRIAKGPLPLEEALSITIQIGEALSRAHEKGIVHRDIKPANILFSSEGSPRITDFGLAAFQGATRLTKTGTSMGTVAYAAPEQLRGETVDHRADIWSLGIVLYEMFAGRPPFEADHEQGVVAQILQEEPQPLTTLRARVPLELDRILQKILAKDPALRYQHLDDLLVDLQGVSDKALVARSEDPTRGLKKVGRRFRGRTLVVSVVTIAAAVVAVWGLFLRESKEQHLMRLAVLPVSADGSDATAIAGGLRAVLYQQLLSLRDLQPIRLSSMDALITTNRAPLDAARQIGADYALESRLIVVPGSGDTTHIQISGEIIELRAGGEVFPFAYDVYLARYFETQNQIVDNIVEMLNLRITTVERAALHAIPSSNPGAILAYLRGVEARRMSDNSDRFDRAIAFFREATERDPTFVWAWAQLAEAYSQWHYVLTVRADGDSLAEAALSQANLLEPDSPMVTRANGYFQYYIGHDYALAETMFRRTIDLHPNDPEAHYARALNLRRVGDWEGAFRSFEQAHRLDPDWPRVLYNYALARIQIRDYDEAERLADQLKVLERDAEKPDWPKLLIRISLQRDGDIAKASELVTRYHQYAGGLEPSMRILARLFPEVMIDNPSPSRDGASYLVWAQAYAALGHSERARAYYDSSLVWSQGTVPWLEARRDPHGHAWKLSAQGLALAGLGRFDEAVAKGEEALLRWGPEQDSVAGIDSFHNLVDILVMCGRYEEAIETLERLLAIPSNISPAILRIDPLWRPLLEYVGFQKLLQGAPRL
ncbi:protein kinase [Gemmatimonadota bacterium]